MTTAVILLLVAAAGIGLYLLLRPRVSVTGGGDMPALGSGDDAYPASADKTPDAPSSSAWMRIELKSI